MSDQSISEKSTEILKKTSNKIGPIYLGDLNRQFLNSGNYTVTESIILNINGSADIIRKTEECQLSVPKNTYESYISNLKQQMPHVKFSKPNFVAGHRFVPTHLMNYSANTLDGKKLYPKEIKEFGSSRIDVPLPIKIRTRKETVTLILPGYELNVKISKLSQNLKDMWYLQWSFSSIGKTKLYLNISVPNLKTKIKSKIFYDQFYQSKPEYQSSFIYHPIIELFFRSLVILKNKFKKRISIPESNVSKSKLSKSKTYTLKWERSFNGPDTMSIHLAYGLIRKKIFSPIGFILSNILVIILTILLTDPLKEIIKFITNWINEIVK